MPFLQRAQGWGEAALAQEWPWRILVALSIALIGLWLARWLVRTLERLMVRLSVEGLLRNFLRNLVYAFAVVVVLVAALDYAGVPTTSLLAVMGAAGLGIGLALKDSLSNIASGVMLIVLRPFHAGDNVQIAGLEGVVEGVRIFQTLMHTADNRQIFLPNSQITSAPIINYTARGERRIDLPLAIAFGDDIPAFREKLLGLASANARVKVQPQPEVRVVALKENHVALELRAWVPAVDYPDVLSELLETILADFAGRGVRLSVPQRDVHLYHHGMPADAAAQLDPSLQPLV